VHYTSSPFAPSGGEHGYPISELRAAFGEDVYEHPEEQGFGECDAETMDQLRRVRDTPGATVRIYRALPPGVGQINRGDWVTLSKQYARQHAMQDDVAANDWPIVQADVPASTVFTHGKDLDEYGYDGPPLSGLEDHAADGEDERADTGETASGGDDD
jgi:hypothetical protein